MIKYLMKCFHVLFPAFFLIACSSANNKPLLIKFSADSAVIIIGNINRAGLLQLKNTSPKDSDLHNLVSVLQTSSENHAIIQELPVKGKVGVTDTSVVFIPANPFIKGRNYQVTTYLNTQFGGAEEMVKGGLNYHINPIRKTLKR